MLLLFVTADNCPKNRAAEPGRVSQKLQVSSEEVKTTEVNGEHCENKNTAVGLPGESFKLDTFHFSYIPHILAEPFGSQTHTHLQDRRPW